MNRISIKNGYVSNGIVVPFEFCGLQYIWFPIDSFLDRACMRVIPGAKHELFVLGCEEAITPISLRVMSEVPVFFFGPFTFFRFILFRRQIFLHRRKDE